jgi:hypothetical protein
VFWSGHVYSSFVIVSTESKWCGIQMRPRAEVLQELLQKLLQNFLSEISGWYCLVHSHPFSSSSSVLASGESCIEDLRSHSCSRHLWSEALGRSGVSSKGGPVAVGSAGVAAEVVAEIAVSNFWVVSFVVCSRAVVVYSQSFGWSSVRQLSKQRSLGRVSGHCTAGRWRGHFGSRGSGHLFRVVPGSQGSGLFSFGLCLEGSVARFGSLRGR